MQRIKFATVITDFIFECPTKDCDEIAINRQMYESASFHPLRCSSAITRRYRLPEEAGSPIAVSAAQAVDVTFELRVYLLLDSGSGLDCYVQSLDELPARRGGSSEVFVREHNPVVVDCDACSLELGLDTLFAA